MTKPQKTSLPDDSLLSGKPSDYTDAFVMSVNSSLQITPVEIARAFFRSSPRWIRGLFWLRNRTVAAFGLKTGTVETDEETIIRNFQGNVGDKVGLFKILDKSDNELIMGEQDRHLDFWVSLFIKDQNLIVLSTVVVIHNWFGQMYFALIKPFHKLIVPTMLKSIVKELERQRAK